MDTWDSNLTCVTRMLFIDQAQYIKGVLSCYGMSGCTSISMPLPEKAQFQPATSEDHLEFSSYPYLEVIRSLMYAALGTCPNIAAVVHTLAPYATSFGKKHIDGVKHICPDVQVMEFFTPEVEEAWLVILMPTGQTMS